MSVTTDPGRRSTNTRPKSALVQVTELSNTPVNPKPLRTKVNSEVVDEYINEQTLRLISRRNDLNAVTFLEIRIDIDNVCCGNFGALLPNLRQLKLSNSRIPTIRDLGSSLNNLEILWMARCCLFCLDGLSSMSNITELYLAFNEISDLSPCVMLEVLEVLDLEGNVILEKSNLNFLKTCKRLNALTLLGNPFISLCGGVKSYRQTVRKVLPQVKVLDDLSIDSMYSSKSTDYDITQLYDEWEYIDTVLREVGLLSDRKLNSEDAKEPVAEGSRRTTTAESSELSLWSNRFGTAPRLASACGRLKTTNDLRHGPCQQVQTPSDTVNLRPCSSASHVSDFEAETDETTSDLTTGQIVCGGISGALRNRRGSAKVNFSSAQPSRTKTNQINKNISSDSVKSVGMTIEKQAKFNASKSDQAPHEITDKGVLNGNKAKHENCDSSVRSILKEEQDLQAECKAVLNELAAWRISQALKTRQDAAKVLKGPPAEPESDVILMSTDSESTLEDRSGASQKSATNNKTPPRSYEGDSSTEKVESSSTVDVSESNGVHTLPGSTTEFIRPKSVADETTKCDEFRRKNEEYSHTTQQSSVSAPRRVVRSKKADSFFHPGTPLVQAGIKARLVPGHVLPGQASLPPSQLSEYQRNTRPLQPSSSEPIPMSRLVQAMNTNTKRLMCPSSASSALRNPFKSRLITSISEPLETKRQSNQNDGASVAQIRPTILAKPASSCISRLEHSPRVVRKKLFSGQTSSPLPSKPSVL
ncbi:hypothetical protein EG68_08676 [Paragonimus skrjabini miyazakii]|uniref:Leucine-rich repeat-containing protein 56 n=1 Tax=Paragonimus skrjabini miyazakii TaxID=59628 RepID=A0A8S9YJD6_9TREM|nr:hypothetical protein EG68_08676 [Paragonimus skrjabini miyazakii]